MRWKRGERRPMKQGNEWGGYQDSCTEALRSHTVELRRERLSVKKSPDVRDASRVGCSLRNVADTKY